jgi:hypothetical protein
VTREEARVIREEIQTASRSGNPRSDARRNEWYTGTGPATEDEGRAKGGSQVGGTPG